MPRSLRKPDKRAVKSSDCCFMIVVFIIILAVLLLCLYAYLFMAKPSPAPAPGERVLLPPSAGQSLQCRDETGLPVDWYIVYKLPQQGGEQGILGSGFAYAFLTSNQKLEHWTLSTKLVTDRSCILAQTLNQIEAGSNASSVLMYNDAPPHGFGKASSFRAHAKGVVAMERSAGFWLIHSVPKFAMPDEYEYPETGRQNGQTALCITIKTGDEGLDIVNQLKHMLPNVYFFRATSDVLSIVPQFRELSDKYEVREDEKIVEVTSAGSVHFMSFARNRHAAQTSGELYSQMVAPKLESSLLVESWRRGAGTNLRSQCRQEFHVSNVQELRITFSPASQVPDSGTWSYKKDHSKWAISESEEKAYVCIGDINRMQSQQKRGGGTVCMRNATIWRLFRNAIHDIEACRA